MDAAGVVDEVGDGVSAVQVGDDVFGTVDYSQMGGANAQYAVLTAWAPKPGVLTWEQAGGAAGNIETATRTLDRLGVKDGTTLLVEGRGRRGRDNRYPTGDGPGCDGHRHGECR